MVIVIVVVIVIVIAIVDVIIYGIIKLATVSLVTECQNTVVTGIKHQIKVANRCRPCQLLPT